jgi:hypothetical protein
MAYFSFRRIVVLISSATPIMVTLLSAILVTSISEYIVNQKVYADGLSAENLPPASVGNRQLSLYLKVNPPILTTTNGKSAYMQFRLFDAVSNQTIH